MGAIVSPTEVTEVEDNVEEVNTIMIVKRKNPTMRKMETAKSLIQVAKKVKMAVKYVKYKEKDNSIIIEEVVVEEEIEVVVVVVKVAIAITKMIKAVMNYKVMIMVWKLSMKKAQVQTIST